MDDVFKEMFKEAVRELLSIDVKEKSGFYGERWFEVSLLLDGNVVNTVYIDVSRN